MCQRIRLKVRDRLNNYRIGIFHFKHTKDKEGALHTKNKEGALLKALLHQTNEILFYKGKEMVEFESEKLYIELK